MFGEITMPVLLRACVCARVCVQCVVLHVVFEMRLYCFLLCCFGRLAE